MIMSITGPREPHDYRDYNIWVPGTTFSTKKNPRGGKKEKKMASTQATQPSLSPTDSPACLLWACVLRRRLRIFR